MKLPFAFGRNQDLEQGQDGEAHLDSPSTENEYCSEDQSIRGLSDLYVPEETGESYVDDIADVLLKFGKLTAEQLAQVRQEQSAEPGIDVTAILLEHQLVSTDDILEARAQQHGLEFRHIKA